MAEDGRQRLGAAVRERRAALRLSVRAAAKLASVDPGTWGDMEASTRALRDYNYAGVERAMQWQPGSVDKILAGGEPAVLPEPAPVLTRDEEIELVRTDPNLSDEAKVDIIRLIFERRASERAAGLAETQRIIEVMRNQAAS